MNSSIWPLDRTLTGTTIPCQSVLGRNNNEGGLNIFQRSRTGASLSDAVYCHNQDSRRVGASYSSAEMQSAYSTFPGDRAEGHKLLQLYFCDDGLLNGLNWKFIVEIKRNVWETLLSSQWWLLSHWSIIVGCGGPPHHRKKNSQKIQFVFLR